MADSVVLLSGGLDSTVVLAMAVDEGREPVALSFRYGQRHSRELESAAAVAEHYRVEHRIIDLDLSCLQSSLLGEEDEIPSGRSEEEMESSIPSTYVPGRNIILMSVAAALCESIGADSVHIGANSVDYSGYPDCRADFFQAFEDMLTLGTRTGSEGRPISIETPILFLSKAEIVAAGRRLGAPLEKTWSCYRGGGKACGTCDSCLLRLKGFAEAGETDGLDYEVEP